jgi:hypothetical protein
MSRIVLGIICGFVFGAIDFGIMLPMSFPDKKAAITAAFIARCGIGFVIGAARLPCDRIAVCELPPNCMIENAAHRVPDLLSRAACKRLRLTKLARDKRLKPLLDCNGFDGSELKFSPMRENPAVQN